MEPGNVKIKHEKLKYRKLNGELGSTLKVGDWRGNPYNVRKTGYKYCIPQYVLMSHQQRLWRLKV